MAEDRELTLVEHLLLWQSDGGDRLTSVPLTSMRLDIRKLQSLYKLSWILAELAAPHLFLKKVP